MFSDFFTKISKGITFVAKLVAHIGYIILLFLETIFFPLQKLRESFSRGLTTPQQDLATYFLELWKKVKTIKLNPHIKIKLPKFKKKEKPKDIWVPQYASAKKTRVKKRSHFLFGLRMFAFGCVFTLLFAVFPSFVYAWFRDLPNPELLITKDVSLPTKILDRKGRLLYEVFLEKRYDPVKLEKIPKDFVNATLAIEDDSFYTHPGFDLTSILRAARAILVDEQLQGGSTITQQLIKNVLLTPERTLSRKLKELTLSVLVEAKYSKNQILELYLNNISYGGTAWGAQSAAQKFFGKDVWDLDLAQSALLAGLPSAPSAYSPLGGDITIAKSRQRYVLDRMRSLGYITGDQAKEAFERQLVFAQQTEYIRAPHFVTYVRQILEEEYGRRFVELGGLTVTTSLDLDVQDKVQQIVTDAVAQNANLNISNGAAVVLSPQSGEILAYVGSIDFFKPGWGAFDVANGSRQPGSSIKPVTYALALENGLTPASIIKDSAVTFRIPGQAPYTPKNYDGKYHGDVTLRAALANSYNIPAVRLANRLGPDNIVKLGKDMGLTNWEVDGTYGLSVTLGGKEVSLLDLVNTYGTLARGGAYYPTTPFVSIKDKNGYEVFAKPIEKKQAVSEETAYIIWNILSDNNARIPAFGSRNSLVIPNKTVAVKTGTTDQIRDNYTIGFTPSYVAGVWVGNNDNSPLNNRLASGISGAAPMWNQIMTELLKDMPDEKMPRPEGVIVKVDESCKLTEVFKKGTTIPDRLCKNNDDDDDKDKNKDKDDD